MFFLCGPGQSKFVGEDFILPVFLEKGSAGVVERQLMPHADLQGDDVSVESMHLAVEFSSLGKSAEQIVN